MIDDGYVIPGAGAFEVAAAEALQEFKNTIKTKAKLGVQAFADSLLVIPKTLAENSAFDTQDAIIQLTDAFKQKKTPVGLNVAELGVIDPVMEGIFDNYIVKRQFLNISPLLAEQLLLVDEVNSFFLKDSKSLFITGYQGWKEDGQSTTLGSELPIINPKAFHKYVITVPI